jgi:hypothetical protein
MIVFVSSKAGDSIAKAYFKNGYQFEMFSAKGDLVLRKKSPVDALMNSFSHYIQDNPVFTDKEMEALWSEGSINATMVMRASA